MMLPLIFLIATLQVNPFQKTAVPPASDPFAPLTVYNLKGNWSRVENFIRDRNHIRFEEYESSDEGKNWTRTNSGTEERMAEWPKR